MFVVSTRRTVLVRHVGVRSTAQSPLSLPSMLTSSLFANTTATIMFAKGYSTMSSVPRLAYSQELYALPMLQQRRCHSSTGDRNKPLQLHFVLPDGSKRTVTGYEGQTLLDVCAENDLPMEGACGGSCACSTCHVYLANDEAIELFPEPTDAENDMLDQAFFPQPTSRLGCQLHLEQAKHNDLQITMPKATRNMYVDGAKVKPHEQICSATDN